MIMIRGDMMFFKKIYTDGLAHVSYMVGDNDGDSIAVIDPRRDVQIYIDEAVKENKRITHIFETHRNEDIISGSLELSEATGARVFISKYEDLGYVYGEEIGESDEFNIGNIKIVPIHTPGHTLGHLSYMLYNREDEPYAVFTGDSLFYGDVGRTDFYGEENIEKMTGLMYDSIFDKLFELEDYILVYPAHGAGSACGGKIEDREASTIGYEKNYNEEVLVSSREEFVERHGYMRLKPPYFDDVEVANVKGTDYLGDHIILNPTKVSEIDESKRNKIIDIRRKEAYIGKHIPGSINLPVSILSQYAGWIYTEEDEVYLMADGVSTDELSMAYFSLKRMGIDKITGVLGNKTIYDMEKSAEELERLNYIDAGDYVEKVKDGNTFTLDVRREEELLEEDKLGESVNIPVQLLSKKLSEVPNREKMFVLCASGIRATLAASILKSAGIDATIVSGGMKAVTRYRENDVDQKN